MSESTRTSRAPAEKRLTYQQWKRRKMLRLARNWVLFLAGCAAVVALLTGGHPVAAAQGARSAGRAKGICSQRVRRHRLCI